MEVIEAKRILIVSDTHGHQEVLKELMERLETPDLVIHCGDLECDVARIQEIVGCQLIAVSGNCDYSRTLPLEVVVQIGKYKVWIPHGHKQAVNTSTNIIMGMAKEKGVDIVLFGHTHQPFFKQVKKVTALNPGSLVFPRQEGRKQTFAMMEIDDKGEAHFTLLDL